MSAADDTTTTVSAVVVTFNRKHLLARCLNSLLSQTRPPDRIIVVDNASSDGTPDYLEDTGLLDSGKIEFHRLDENTGGAGGFHAGLALAEAAGDDWFWLMDDDAVPDCAALASLLAVNPDPGHVYGSCALSSDAATDDRLCWPTTLANGTTAFRSRDLSSLEPVGLIPFLGFFISSSLVTRIGRPDKDFFIHGDDFDYCLRILSSGATLHLARDSIIRHPYPARRTIRLFGRTLLVSVLSPTKRYYDVRNRIVIARRHFGIRLWTQALPGTILRLFYSLAREPQRLKQLRAYVLGMLDGVRQNMVRRTIL